MAGPAQASESETSLPNLSPTSSASSSSSRTPKSVIDSLCTQIANTTLASDSVQRSHGPFMQGQSITCPLTPRPPATHHSPPPLPPPPLSFGDPMEFWKSDGVGGFPPEEEECKTPTGEEYRIPEPVKCPPAPKRSRRHWSERPACAENKEEEAESVDSSEVEEALKKKR